MSFGTVREYEAAVRARIESGDMTELEWTEVLDAVLLYAEGLVGTPALDAALGIKALP